MRRLNKQEQLTHKIVRELLDYDPDTGVFTWKHRHHKWFRCDEDCNRWNGRFAGNRAFPKGDKSHHSNGRILHTHVKAHRIAFLLMTGKWPDPEVTHINAVRNDNRWSNLRKATRSQNRTPRR